MEKERLQKIISDLGNKLDGFYDVDMLSGWLEELDVSVNEAFIVAMTLLGKECLWTFEYKHQTFWTEEQKMLVRDYLTLKSGTDDTSLSSIVAVATSRGGTVEGHYSFGKDGCNHIINLYNDSCDCVDYLKGLLHLHYYEVINIEKHLNSGEKLITIYVEPKTK